MWKLNVGVNKKVGRPNYGSQGASVTLEAEEAGDVLQDPEILRRRARELFAAARAAVDEELAAAEKRGEEATEAEMADATSPRFAQRRATPRQVRALESLAERCRADLPHLATYYFRVDDVRQLTRRQASMLIRRLQAEGQLTDTESPAA
jgi:hypothetical protein